MWSTVEVMLRAYANVIGGAKFYLLAQAETIHCIRQWTHVRFLVLVEDLPSGATLVRQ